MRLHYSADPDKNTETADGRQWLEDMKKGWPGGLKGTKWQQEMEINFKIVGGSRVFPAWDDMLQHILQEPFEIGENWPLHAAYDYGTYNPCSFGVYAFEGMERAYKIDEVVERGMSVHEQAQLIKSKPWWHRVKGSIVGDPSIWRLNQSGSKDTEELTSIGQLFEDEGIFIAKGRNDPGVDMSFVNLLQGLLWADLENPMYKIFTNCKATIRSYRNLRKQERRTPHAKAFEDNPEAIVRRGVDPFDSDKYMFLSRGFEEPGVVDYRPGTWGWYEQQVAEVAMERTRILG
jgi:hypothetical protein